MTKKSCEEIRDLLVDYADGELAERDSQEVAEHLADCPACRQIVRTLERSLHLAKAIWLDSLEAPRTNPVRHYVIGWWRYAAVAAVFLIIASVPIFTSIRRPAGPDIAYARIEQHVTSVAAAARLLAATQILAQCEGTESIVEEQHRYILDHYADTPAAQMLRNSNALRRNPL